jgi:hypothetical protein
VLKSSSDGPSICLSQSFAVFLISSLLVAAPRGQHYFLCGLAIGWANPVVFAPIRGDGQTVNECKDDWDSHGICATVAYNPDLMD